MTLWDLVYASIPVLIDWVICIRIIAKMEDKP